MQRFFLVKGRVKLSPQSTSQKETTTTTATTNQNSGMFESSDLIFTPPQPKLLLETTNPLQQHKI